MNNGSKKSVEEIKDSMIQICYNIVATDISKLTTWESDCINIKPSSSLTPEELMAIKEVKFKSVEYTGKNPRTVSEMSVELYDKVSIMNIMCRLLEEKEPNLVSGLHEVLDAK